MYDNNGDYFGFTYNGVDYYYLKNAQNDVIAITDNTGAILARYNYEAWGRATRITDANGIEIPEDHIGNLNPIRYRSYYYDVELGLYYLNTRYYLPDMCRFINADDTDVLDADQDSLVENNLFAYCLNNPVNMTDDDGELASRIIFGIAGGAMGATIGALASKKFGLTGWKKAAAISAGTLLGIAAGALSGPYIVKAGAKVAAKVGIRTAVKQTIKMSTSNIWKRSASHIFSKSHIKGGIMRLGRSQKSIFNSLTKAVNSNLSKAVNGSNQIHTKINGVKTTIRFYVSNGEVQSMDAFVGWASRIIGKLL